VRAADVFHGGDDRAMKFGTLTLPSEVDAGIPSQATVEADRVAWRRFRRHVRAADSYAEEVLGAHFLLWKREVGEHGQRRLHRHLLLVTHLSNRKLVKLARRAGYGLVVNFKLVRSGAMAARYVSKYVAKAGAGLSAWPAHTRWAHTWIKPSRREGPRPRWLVDRFPKFATARAVLACLDARLARASAPDGVAPRGEVLSPSEADDAWVARPP
jgi:hypothetical protein